MISASTDEHDDERRWHAIQHRRQQVVTVRAVEALRSHGIESLVIKGAAAARYYPEGTYRISVDVDLAVAESDFAKADNLLKSGVIQTPIDLHRELRHLDTTPWNDLLDNSILLALPEGQVRVLRPEDDLRLLVVHWLTDGGSNHDRLWDIYYLIDGRDEHFDWDRCLGLVDERRRRWIDCAVGVTAKYLGLDLSGTPLEGAADRLPSWVVRTIEREWSAKTKHVPLEAVVRDRRKLLPQLVRRLRPNPLYATIDCGGSLDAKTRVFYQIRNWFRRIPASYRRVSAEFGSNR